MVLLVVLQLVVFLVTTEPVISQSNVDHEIVPYINVFNRSACGVIAPLNQLNFLRNRNSTLSQLRVQLLNQGSGVFVRAQDLTGGDTVYAETNCRNYLSTDQCVACFDAGLSVLAKCTTGNGAYVTFDDCYIRYEDFADFYGNANVMQEGVGTAYSSCDDKSAATQQITSFEGVVDALLKNIRDATPKSSNFYVAFTRKIPSDNTTVYAIGQCPINKAICLICMNTAYSKLSECLPSTEARFWDMGCYARYSQTPFFNDNQITDITTVLKGRSSKATTIGGTSAGVLLFFGALVMWFLYRQRKKAKETEDAELKGAVHYNYNDLQLATNNFGEENILGKGGFGEVFKATLDDNTVVAVKKLQVQHAGVREEFENEVKLISHVHHRNLLRLLGWSSEGSNLLLVLEYMPSGSLDQFLWGSRKGTLDWNQRYEIIFGIAKGLAHLHNEFHVKIIHRDVKSTNILLTDDFKPKIADFGLARFLPEDETHIITQFAGTLGYTAPEYALRGILSDKVDTYSFGIVVLEIISSKRCTEVKSNKSASDYLLEEAWKSYENKVHMKFIDQTLGLNQQQQEHVMKITEIALLCTQPAPKRPTMSEVVLMLQDGQPLGRRELIRPTYVQNHERRIHIGSFRNSNIAVDNVCENPQVSKGKRPAI